MIRLACLLAVVIAGLILLVVVREERLAAHRKVPLGRLRRLWLKPERRRAPRYRVDWPVRYRRVDSTSVNDARVRDLSQTGVGLIVRERLPADSQIQIEFILPDPASPVSATGKVRWIREVPAHTKPSNPERLFFIGVQFYEINSQTAAQLKAALQTSGAVEVKWEKA